jgi:hypothetical protein
MKAVCDLLLNPRWYGKIHVSDLYWLSLLQRNYLNYLGPEKIRTIGYREVDIKREIYNETSGDIIKEGLSRIFSIGSRYSLKDIKTKLSSLYFDLGIVKTPKASDLEDYYHVKTCLIYDPITKKQSRGYEILSLK